MLRTLPMLLLLLASCWGQNAHILQGTVVDVVSPTEVLIDHEAVPGVMGPMVMPFKANDPSVFAEIKPGDIVVARLMTEKTGYRLDRVRVTGHTEPPKQIAAGPMPVQPGALFPRTELPLASGGTLVIGQGQTQPVLLTYLYTTCPFPEMCPATVLRLQQLAAQLSEEEAQLAIVTLAPQTDTPQVLAEWGSLVGATPPLWQLARPEGKQLEDVAMRAALSVMEQDGAIVHAIRWLVLDKDGRLIERYDDNHFPADRVLQQLRTGGPAAPAGIVGTVTDEAKLAAP